MSRRQELLAPAKLTVSLRVLGRRPDGYHDLEAEMVSLNLFDSLVVDPDGDGLEVVSGGGTGVHALPAGADNIVRRALAAVGRRAGVRLVKRIPVGGGLGGGSADAAAILRWAGCSDPIVAASLGADVPFCIHGGRAMVGGIGDRVSPLPYVPRSFVLLVPPFPVDTAAVYRRWDHLDAGQRDAQSGAGHNDLTAAAVAEEPRLGAWGDLLGELSGAVPVLAGSGSTWWVEGTPETLGLTADRPPVLGHDQGLLVPARTVPADWLGPGRHGEPRP